MIGKTFSLRGLLIAVAVTALGLAIWLSSGPWMASAVFSFALLMPAVAAIAAFAAQGERRCRWLGCLVLSAGYLWSIMAPGSHPMMTPSWMIQQEGPLLTSKLNEWLYLNVFVKLRPPPPLPAGMGMGMGGMYGGMGGGMPSTGTFLV